MSSFYTHQHLLWFLKIRILRKEWGVSETRINAWIQVENLWIQRSLSWLLLLSLLTVPVFMTPPSVSALSPYSLNVSWEMPADNVTRGKVVGYNVSMVSEQSPQQSSPVVFSQVLLFSTNDLSELNYVFILTFSVFAEFWQNFHLYWVGQNVCSVNEYIH